MMTFLSLSIVIKEELLICLNVVLNIKLGYIYMMRYVAIF